MFSANENITLRQYKRRVIQYVEETIPESLLDLGTTVLAMQVSCRAPGCVPLETVITICFPSADAVLPDLVLVGASATTFQTKILMPMSEITKEEVLEALPPAFEGGLQSMERLGLRARDVMLAQVTQLFEDVPSRKVMAEYLKECLQDYTDRDCEAPEYGEPFAELTVEEKGVTKAGGSSKLASTMASIQSGTGNIVIRRVIDEDSESKTESKGATVNTKTTSTVTASAPSKAPVLPASANDWRRQQNMERQMNNTISTGSSAQLLSQLEHAPGIRRAGCPCCDPDNPSNYVDSMMML